MDTILPPLRKKKNAYGFGIQLQIEDFFIAEGESDSLKAAKEAADKSLQKYCDDMNANLR